MKNNIDFIQKPKAGEPITESLLNSLIDSVNQLKSQIKGDKSPEYVNPSIVRCVNGLSTELPIFSVVHLENATITENAFFESSGGGTQDSRVYAKKPDGEDNEPFGIIRSNVGPGFEVSAVCSGFSCCKIKVDDSKQENCEFAKPVKNITEYLQASETGPCRIVWKEEGVGKKWAYVIINREQIFPQAFKFFYTSGNPEGVNSLDNEIYVEELNKFGYRNVENERAYNPLNFPDGRHCIVSQAKGFPLKDGEESTDPKGGKVILSADVRDILHLSVNSGDLSFLAGKTATRSGYLLSAGDAVIVQHSGGNYSLQKYTSAQMYWRPAICLADLPTGWDRDFDMPISFAKVLGNEPNYSTSSSSIYDKHVGLRCGMDYKDWTENKLDSKGAQYRFTPEGLLYDPFFTFVTTALDSSQYTLTPSVMQYPGTVAIEFCGRYYRVDLSHVNQSTHTWGGCMDADIYAGDRLTILADVSGSQSNGDYRFTVIDCPRDYPSGTQMIFPRNNTGGRGWVDVTSLYSSQSGCTTLVTEMPSGYYLGTMDGTAGSGTDIYAMKFRLYEKTKPTDEGCLL